MLTCQDIAEQALAACRDWGFNFPVSRALHFRRIGMRQQQLITMAVGANADYFGVEAIGDLDAGVLDLADMLGQVDVAAHVQKVTIDDPGTSAWPIGTEVSIVPLRNPEATIAPRAFIRDALLIGVDTDLDGVTELRLYYTKMPASLSATDANTAVVIPDPHAQLLVLDLQLYMVAAAPQASPTVSAAVAGWQAEQADLVKAWLGYVAGYAAIRQQFSGHTDVAAS